MGLKLSLAVLFTFISYQYVSAFQTKEGGKDQIVEAEAELQKDEEGTCFARYNLGRMPVGEQVDLKLKVINPLDEEFRFNDVSKKCACSQFKPEKYLIPKMGELNARLRIKIPGLRNSTTATSIVQLVRGATPVVQLRLEYELKGLLAFTELIGVVSFDSDGQTKSIDIPFVVTEPIVAKDLSVRASKNLDAVKLEIVPADNGGTVRATVSDSILEKGKIRGEIYLEHRDSGKLTAAYLTIKNAKLADISPQVISFRKSGAGMTGNATIRLAKTAGQIQEADAAKPQVSCTFADRQVDLEVSQLSRELLRVTLTVDEKAKSAMVKHLNNHTAGPGILNWHVVNGESTTKLSTPFIVEKEN